MLGNPLYTCKQKVRFHIEGDIVKEGVIWIVDAYGTFEQSEEVSYDIYIESENCLYKHIRESMIVSER